ncbi:MAG: hypothetical protein CVU50_09120 [Candidatus Cloacimonetes bacterium HGW-Cloacimonetes-3]|jgi:PAS domain S-box-containing protein|nr:MAG: hypothetical protein CVU50_09120 [Candidatus Cloacimonetes bacterium HGW-Cloacimonetes-3]
MRSGILVSLIYNAALLLALGMIFDSVTLRNYQTRLWAKLLSGFSLGLIALAIMINPWVLIGGVVFDTRSILFSIIGMFFGTVPAIISLSIAVAYRIWLGGSGVYMGVSVIVASLGWGYIWKRLHHKWKHPFGIVEFYSLGIANHLTMLGLTVLLPAASRGSVLWTISLPVMTLYPIVTVVLGQMLVKRMQLRREKYALETSEEQFRILYESAPIAYQSLDVNGNFITVNKTWLHILGYDLEDVLGKNFSQFIDSDNQPLFAECFAEFKITGSMENNEFGLLKKDGSQILASFNGTILYDVDGKFKQTQCVFTDITERRKQETALLKIKADWEAIFQSIPHPTFILDKDQTILAANANLEKATGFSTEQMKGRKCWELMHGEDATEPPPGCPFAESCDSDNDISREMEVSALGGWFLVTCKPIFDESGQIDKVIHIAMDITERKKNELILLQSEEKYRLLSETAQDIILVHHFDGSVSYANQKALSFLGVNQEELASINILDYVAEEYHAMLAEHSKERQEGYLGSRVYPLELITWDKCRIQVEVSSTPIVSDNQITGILAVVRDITERLADQQAIKESQERFESFMDNLPGGVFIKDAYSALIYVNQYLKNVHSADRKIGLRPHSVYPKEIANAIVEEDQQTLMTGFRTAIEEILHNDGVTHLYETTKFVLPNPNGEPLIGGIALDVTQKLLAEEQKNRYAKRIEILHTLDSIVLETLSFDSVCNAVVENLQQLMPFTVLTVNVLSEGTVTFPAFLKPKGRFEYLTLGTRYTPNQEFMQELAEQRTVVIHDASSSRPTPGMPIRANMVEDGIKSLMYNAMIIQDELVGFLWFSSDYQDFFTSEYREIADEFANQLAIVLHHLQLIQRIKEYALELEQKVDERTKQLTSSNQELEAFSYSVAHDLRSPLRTIDGYCSILMEDYAPDLHENALTLLSTIRATSHRMDTLIQELLLLAKITRNALQITQVNMYDMASQISSEILISKAPLQFDVIIDELPDCLADYTLIGQVWQNLLENAVKFSAPCATRQIHIGYEKRDKDTVYFVKDSGVGFNMEFVDKIFGAFQRLHRETEFEGTGIGLAIVKKIIDRHFGEVWATSCIGTGSTLFFSLPDEINID